MKYTDVYVKLRIPTEDGDRLAVDRIVKAIKEKIRTLAMLERSNAPAEPPKKRLTIGETAAVWCNIHRVQLEDLRGKARTKTIASVRRHCMRSAYQKGFSYNEIAEFFNRERSTVVSAIKKAKEEDWNG